MEGEQWTGTDGERRGEGESKEGGGGEKKKKAMLEGTEACLTWIGA